MRFVPCNLIWLSKLLIAVDFFRLPIRLRFYKKNFLKILVAGSSRYFSLFLGGYFSLISSPSSVSFIMSETQLNSKTYLCRLNRWSGQSNLIKNGSARFIKGEDWSIGPRNLICPARLLIPVDSRVFRSVHYSPPYDVTTKEQPPHHSPPTLLVYTLRRPSDVLIERFLIFSPRFSCFFNDVIFITIRTYNIKVLSTLSYFWIRVSVGIAEVWIVVHGCSVYSSQPNFSGFEVRLFLFFSCSLYVVILSESSPKVRVQRFQRV